MKKDLWYNYFMKLTFIFLFFTFNLSTASHAQSSFVNMLGFDTVTTLNPAVNFYEYNITPIPGTGGYYVAMITDYLDTIRTTIIKTDNDLNPIWAKRFSGNNFTHLCADSAGNAYISGFVVDNPHTLESDIALAKLDSSGNLAYVTLLEGPQNGLTIHFMTPGADGDMLFSGTIPPNSLVYTGKMVAATGHILWIMPSGHYDVSRLVQAPGGSIYTLNTVSPYDYGNSLVKLDASGVNIFYNLYRRNMTTWNRFTDVILTSGGQLKILAETTDTVNGFQSTATMLTLDTLGNMISQHEFYVPLTSAFHYMKPVRIFEKSPGHYCIVASEPYNLAQTDNFLVFGFDDSSNVTSSFTYHDHMGMGSYADQAFLLADGTMGVAGKGRIPGNVAVEVDGPVLHKIFSDYTSSCEYIADTIEVHVQPTPFQLFYTSTGNVAQFFAEDTVDVNRFRMTQSPIGFFEGCNGVTTVIREPVLENTLHISVDQKVVSIGAAVVFPARITVFNTMGQSLKTIDFAHAPVRIDLSAFAAGCYLAVLQTGNGSFAAGKFVVE
jgi:hypothetical protein